MNRMSLRILWLDGTSKEVSVSASDIVAAESKFELALDKMDRITHFIFLAYSADKRLKTTAKTFEEWLDDVDTVEALDPKESKG